MTDADVKALNIILDHVTKTFTVQTEKILLAVEKLANKKPRGPKPVPASVKLQRAHRKNANLRREVKELHSLLEKELKRIQ